MFAGLAHELVDEAWVKRAACGLFNAEVASHPSTLVKLAGPTADQMTLVRTAVHVLQVRMVEGVPYIRADVMPTRLEPTGEQPMFDEFTTIHEK